MDRITNPFAPGAGTQPPELAGRETILEDVDVTLSRIRARISSRSAIFVGLRGVGKTVLLNRVREIAEEKGFRTISMEAHEGKSLPALLLPHLRKHLLQLNGQGDVTENARRALRVFKSFVKGLKIKASIAETFDLELGIDPEPGTADSGDLEHDLTEMLVATARAAESKNESICLLVDELQYLREEELSALILALHQISQQQLPTVFYGAGLPLILGLAGRSKSYSERLFEFPRLDILDAEDAGRALSRPVRDLGVSFMPDAIQEILDRTQRYPYFLQQWGYEAWDAAKSSPIRVEDIRAATVRAIQKLDEGFFRVRFDRLTKREKDFLFAMLDVGGEQQRSGDIADRLGVKATSIGPLRSSLIRKGMIYSPAHGDNAFTVPLFSEFLHRQRRI